MTKLQQNEQLWHCEFTVYSKIITVTVLFSLHNMIATAIYLIHIVQTAQVNA